MAVSLYVSVCVCLSVCMYVHLSVSVSVQSARRELEHQRQSEWECQRREQLVAERLREQGRVDSLSAELGQLRRELDVLVSLCWVLSARC